MYDSQILLHQMREGESARVISLLQTGPMRRRLQDIGLIEGTEVQCLQQSPSGDPIAYAIRGAVIALRAVDAKRILVAQE